ncbi:MAG: CC0125/CC1285 family lipoprotein [Kiloniellales bacterium]
MRFFGKATGLLSLLFLAGCAGAMPSPYQAFDGRYGFSERTLGNATEVHFAGNRLTPRETVEDFALYRAAEVTLASGFERFAVIGNEVEQTTTRYYNNYGPWPYRPYYRPHYRHYGYPFYGYPFYPRPYFPPTVSVETRYQAILTIVPFRGQPPERAIRVEEAEAVVSRLAAQVHPPPPTS